MTQTLAPEPTGSLPSPSPTVRSLESRPQSQGCVQVSVLLRGIGRQI